MTTATKSLAAKLAEVLAAVDRIPKNGHNDIQNYDFVRSSDVLDSVRKALAERNVGVTVSVIKVEHTPYVTANQKPQFLTTVYGNMFLRDGDGQGEISIPFAGTGSDSGDKGYYKAVTGGLKYALLSTFLIPTGDDPEQDVAALTTEVQREIARRTPVEPRVVGQSGLTTAQRGKFFALLRENGIEGDQRKAFLALSLQKHSTKDLTPGDFDFLVDVLEHPEDSANAKLIEDAKEAKS